MLLHIVNLHICNGMFDGNQQLHNTDTHQALIFKGIVNASEEQPERP